MRLPPRSLPTQLRCARSHDRSRSLPARTPGLGALPAVPASGVLGKTRPARARSTTVKRTAVKDARTSSSSSHEHRRQWRQRRRHPTPPHQGRPRGPERCGHPAQGLASPAAQALSARPQPHLACAGTLHVGAEAVPGSQAALERLRQAGVECRFVTNTTKDTISNLLALVQGLGFAIQRQEVRCRGPPLHCSGTPCMRCMPWHAAPPPAPAPWAAAPPDPARPRPRRLARALQPLAGVLLPHRHPPPAGGAAAAPLPAAAPQGAARL